MVDSQVKKQKSEHNDTRGNSVPSTPDSVNLGDDGGSYGSLDRPLGMKAEKAQLRKSKSKEAGGDAKNLELVILLVVMQEEKKVANEKKFAMMEKCYLQEQQRLLHEEQRLLQEKEKMKIEQMKEEDRIMSMDTSCMRKLQAEYYQHRQMEILGKKV